MISTHHPPTYSWRRSVERLIQIWRKVWEVKIIYCQCWLIVSTRNGWFRMLDSSTPTRCLSMKAFIFCFSQVFRISLRPVSSLLLQKHQNVKPARITAVNIAEKTCKKKKNKKKKKLLLSKMAAMILFSSVPVTSDRNPRCRLWP